MKNDKTITVEAKEPVKIADNGKEGGYTLYNKKIEDMPYVRTDEEVIDFMINELDPAKQNPDLVKSECVMVDRELFKTMASIVCNLAYKRAHEQGLVKDGGSKS